MTPVPRRKSTRATRDPSNLSLMRPTSAQTKKKMIEKTKETCPQTKTSYKSTKRRTESARNCYFRRKVE